jgi:hypothetical protein
VLNLVLSRALEINYSIQNILSLLHLIFCPKNAGRLVAGGHRNTRVAHAFHPISQKLNPSKKGYGNEK